MSGPELVTTISYHETLVDIHTGQSAVVETYLDKVRWATDEEETTNEQYFVEGEWVEYGDLTARFGEPAVAAFITRAQERAR